MLSDQQIHAYERNGYLSGIQVMKESEVQYFRNSFDELEVKEGREKAQIGLIDRHFDQKFIWEIATHPLILDSVSAILGPDLLLLSTHFFCKYGPDEKFVAWHQDLKYWELDPPIEITAWYAVDDSDSGNGCMRVIPRLHRDQLLEHGKSVQDGNLLSVDQELELAEKEEENAVDCVLKAGEISLHDGMLIHGSLPNRSTRRRCGLSIRYVPASVMPQQAGSSDRDWDWSPTCVRGTIGHDFFKLREHPFPLKSAPTI